MSPERFDHLLELVKSITKKKRHQLTKSMPAAEKLAITLRFLAIWELQQSLNFSYRLGKATVSKIISEICKAIYTVLKDPYLLLLLLLSLLLLLLFLYLNSVKIRKIYVR